VRKPPLEYLPGDELDVTDEEEDLLTPNTSKFHPHLNLKYHATKYFVGIESTL
jgi:hypothetical protein